LATEKYSNAVTTREPRSHKFHKAFGLLGGLQYVAMRRRNPRIGAGMGLLFGAAFFLFGDEILVSLMRWTPGPRAFSWKVHARGAAAHVAYGVAAEAMARVLDRASAMIERPAYALA
jgi:uncharacterized membrane protein YagU involved in acid resistance